VCFKWELLYTIFFCYCRIQEIPELFIIGRPDMTIVAFGSEVVDIFEVNDIMSLKGWHLNALQRPNRYVCSLKHENYVIDWCHATSK
jgi:sphinganine-1-phosphate aldolase